MANLQGEEKVVQCAFEAMFDALIEVIKASNRPAAAIESTREEIIKGFEGLQMLAAARVAQAMIEE